MLYGLPPSYGRIALANTKASHTVDFAMTKTEPVLSFILLLQDVTAEDILRVIKKWIAPIFDPATSIGAVASGLAKQDELVKQFETIGYEVEKRNFGADDDDESGSETGSETGSEA